MEDDIEVYGKGPFKMPRLLKKRPVFKRHPVPIVNEHLDKDGEEIYDFTAVNGVAALRFGQARKCGLCGDPMFGTVAFLGGPMSAGMGTYSDPPMHIPCARAALRLCPHIAKQKPQRAKKSKVDVHTPDGFVEDKPQAWVLYITNNYTIMRKGKDYVFKAAAPTYTEVHGYDEGGNLE